MTSAAPSVDTRWAEPAMAVLALAFALVVQPDQGLPARLLTLTLCLGAGLSAMVPRVASVLTVASLLSFLALPAADVSVAGLASFINVFAAIRLDLRWKVPLVALLSCSAYATMVWHSSTSLRDHLISAAFVLVLAALAIGAGSVWRIAAGRVLREREVADERVAELRAALARDLHDTVAQTLSHAAMRAHMLALSPEATPAVREGLGRIAEECSSSAHDLRQLLSTLREHDGPPPGFIGPLADADTLAAAVEEQAQRLRDHGFMATTEVRIGPVSSARATTLAKVTVEAASNMIKHAAAGTQCHLSITEDDDDLIAVFSNRTTASRVNPRGLGLIGIEERAGLLRGTCRVVRDAGWWHVRVRLPHGYEVAQSDPAGR